MKIQGSIVLAGLVGLVITGSLLYGCSKKSKSVTGPGTPSNTPFDSQLQNSGFVFTHTFPVEGDVPYHCTPHASSGMTGTVFVRASSTTDLAAVTVGSGGLRFVPDTITVKSGGQVRWTWASSGHTVTSGTPTAAAMAMPDMPGMAGHGGR